MLVVIVTSIYDNLKMCYCHFFHCKNSSVSVSFPGAALEGRQTHLEGPGSGDGGKLQEAGGTLICSDIS